MRSAWFVVAAFAAQGLAAANGCAQAPLSAEVSWSAAKVAGGDYGDRTRTSVDARLQVSLPTFGSNRLLIGGASERYTGWKPIVIAPVACLPPGACGGSPSRPGAPDFAYTAFVVGLRHRAGDSFVLGAGVGFGTVNLFAGGSGWHSAVSADADASMRWAGPLRLFLRAEIIRFNAGASTLYACPLSVGVRLN
ncbi:MAG: hypothetical protein KGJ70_11925 [Gemmatimonadota bacterium]|nr:hypothetical protein [Gemmatimonadota bacterium]